MFPELLKPSCGHFLTMVAAATLAAAPLGAQTVFFSDGFTRLDSLDIDAMTNGMAGSLISSGNLTAGNTWLEPIDIGKNNQFNSQVTNSVLQLGGQGNAVNIVLDRNFATVLSSGVISITTKLVGTPKPNDTSAIHRYQGIGFGFSRAEGNVASSTVDRVLSRTADVFVAETANGRIRINDESPSTRVATGDLSPTVSIPLSGATAFVAGTLRIDLTLTNVTAGSTVAYTVLFDAGNTGNFATITNRTFVLSGSYELYTGLEERSTPAVHFDDFTVSALAPYSPPPDTGLTWRAQGNNLWDTSTTNWINTTFGNPESYYEGAIVRFDDTALDTTVTVLGTLNPGPISVANVNSNYTFTGTGFISGTNAITKSGTGTLTLAINNQHTGGTVLSGGKVRLAHDSALGNGPLLLSSGTLASDSATPRTVSLSTSINGAITLGDASENGQITFTEPLDLAASGRTLTISSPVLFQNGITNGTITSKVGKSTLTINGIVNLTGASDTQNGTLIFDNATVTDTDRLIVDSGIVGGIARMIITNGSRVTVNTTAGNLRSGRTASTGTNYLDLAGLYSLPNADTVNGNLTLQGNAVYSEVTLWPGGDFTARSVTNVGGIGNTVLKFNGGILRARNDNLRFFEGLSQALIQDNGANIDDNGYTIAINQNLLNAGNGGLTKTGSGTLLLNGNNTYAGTTEVKEGSLGGSGSLSGPVHLFSGATLAPGNTPSAIGTLTINNSLTLDPGSAVVMQIDKGTTRDMILGLTDVSYAGLLVISNSGATPFAPGDTFDLFSASGTKSGDFNIVHLQPDTGLQGHFDPASGQLVITQKPSGSDTFTVYANSLNNSLNVLDNDAGNNLALVGISSPAHGVAAIAGNHVVYTPNTGYIGVDTFTYTNQSDLDTAILPVTINVIEQPAVNDHYQVLKNTTNNILEVLRNDGAGLTLVSVTAPTNGEVSLSGTNLLYSPARDYFGPDSVTYTAQDSQGKTMTATVSLDVRQYPNFVFILTDDQGWTGTSVQMDTNRPNSKSDYYQTPRIETLASHGLRFSYGYAPHPNCSPSRYANLTGKNCARLKLTDIIDRSDAPVANQFKLIAPGKAVNAIQSSEKTIAELLKTIPGAGYSAAHFGKWHLAGGGPVAHGFDSDANDGATDNGPGSTGTTPINADPKRVYSVTDRALSYLDSRVGSGTPFYIQVSHYAVHESTQCSQSAYDAFAGVPIGTWHTNRYYAGMTLDLDVNVGRVLEKLDDLGIRNSTYIIYQGDNGAPQSQSENYPLRGYKPEVWEGGTRTPTFISGPGVPSNAQCDTPVCGIDFLPTIWEWATGSAASLPVSVDGGSLVPAINSLSAGSNAPAMIERGGELVHHSPHYVGPSAWPNDYQVNAKDMRPRSTIHSGHYKLVANYEPGTIELYDLDGDIGEQTNLSPEQQAIKWQLWVRLRDYLKLVNAQMPTLDPTYKGTTNGTFSLAAATGPLGDADNDGLSDEWEFRELLTYQFNGNDDTDHDGVGNADELAQGTDPLVPNGYRVNTITKPEPNQLRLTWNATPGASFVVETSTNLVDWVEATTVESGNVYAGAATVQTTIPHAFFRVRKL